MTKRILDHDPLSGITEYFDYDHTSDTMTIQTVQDVTPIIEFNKALQKDTSYWSKGVKKEFVHAARIPNNIINKWLIEDGIDVFNPQHKERVRRKLNDPDYRYLRTSNNKL